MNRNKYGFICVVAVTMLMLASGCGMRTRVITPDSEEYESIPLFAQCLIEAYPDEIVGYADNHLVWNDGTTLLYDDGLDKSVQEMLEEGDNEDMSYWLYTNVVEPFNPNRSLGRLLYPFSIF